MPVNFIHKILTQLNFCFKKMVKINKYHTDIKPRNIFIIYNDEEKNNFDIRLGGCNLSIEQEGINYSSISENGRLEEEEGERNESSYYESDKCFKAPEILEQGNHNKSDLWSIGVLIYYLNFLEYLKNPYNFKKPSDEKLKDLVIKLIEPDIKKRMNWDEYFSHNFFSKY